MRPVVVSFICVLFLAACGVQEVSPVEAARASLEASSVQVRVSAGGFVARGTATMRPARTVLRINGGTLTIADGGRVLEAEGEAITLPPEPGIAADDVPAILAAIARADRADAAREMEVRVGRRGRIARIEHAGVRIDLGPYHHDSGGPPDR